MTSNPVQGPARVLVVADRAEVRRELVRQLKALGHPTTDGGGSLEALDCASRTPVDVILCDAGLRLLEPMAFELAAALRGIRAPVVVANPDADDTRMTSPPEVPTPLRAGDVAAALAHVRSPHAA